MTTEFSNKRALEIEAEDLERLSVKLIQDQNWQVLEKMLAPGCQFVSSQGACDKESAMRLMKEMHLGPVQFKDFKVTEAGDNLIISFWIAALEYRDGKELSPEYSPRLSVWKKMDSRWQCIAYADLIASK
jgi:hypothetical protein